APPSGREPEPERRPGGERGAREGPALGLRVVDRLSAARLARRGGGLSADARGQPADAGRRRRAQRSRSHLPAGVLAARDRHHPRLAGRGRARPLVLRAAPLRLDGAAGLERAAVRALALAAALLPLAARAAPAEDWFRAYQYAARPQTLRGCSDCAGERDDLCEVPAGVLVQPI